MSALKYKRIFILKNHTYANSNSIIKASIELQNSQLKLNYQIVDKIFKYHFPKQTKQQRVDNLWLDTCFELFIANRGKEEYWEINISPSTEWNSYHFTKYKEGMRESNLFSTPQIETSGSETRYRLSFETTIQKGILIKELEINISIILLDRDGKRNFYSINRRDDYPDFHDRLGWV